MNMTAIQVMGISPKNFNDMTHDYSHNALVSIKDALTVVAAKSPNHAFLWQAIGINERQFNRLDDLFITRLSNHWARLKDPKKFEELAKQQDENRRLQRLADMGLTEKQFMDMPDNDRATIIASFAAADGQKAAAKEAAKAKMFIGGAFAGALAITGLFGSLAMMEFAPAQPNFDIRCSSGDAACMEVLQETIKTYGPATPN